MKRKNEQQASQALQELYRSFGYTAYKMSRFEEYELYVRNKEFLLSDRVITFSDPSGKLLAMKPDVTLSIVKNAPEHSVRKVYYQENVYRDFREIMQAGLECVGCLDEYDIAEVTVLAAKSMALLGEEFVLSLSHMGLIEAVLQPLDSAQRRQAMDALRRKSLHALSGIRADIREKLEWLSLCRVPRELEALLTAPAERRALEELSRVVEILEKEGFGRQVRLDFSVSSDLRYYSGLVFKGYLATIPTGVLSGGQYDRLPQRMGRKARAIGFAIYLDLLQSPEPEDELDTLLLHDGSDPAAVMELRRTLPGRVLVTRQIPEGRCWRQLIRFEKGEVRCD